MFESLLFNNHNAIITQCYHAENIVIILIVILKISFLPFATSHLHELFQLSIISKVSPAAAAAEAHPGLTTLRRGGVACLRSFYKFYLTARLLRVQPYRHGARPIGSRENQPASQLSELSFIRMRGREGESGLRVLLCGLSGKSCVFRLPVGNVYSDLKAVRVYR